MRILYVAKHDSGGADDEGAIAFALEQLGHQVFRCDESRESFDLTVLQPDFCLFHKWGNFEVVAKMRCPKAFWHFDRIVDWHPKRMDWVRRVLPLVDVGFVTDGDLLDHQYKMGSGIGVSQQNKLVWLPQGADERVVGRGTPDPAQAVDVLCVAGTRFHGERRQSFVRELAAFCVEKGFTFRHVEEGVYRERLRDLVASAKIVVAPDSPVSDRYWSNRVWNMLGFGAMLLHPTCKGLFDFYPPTDLQYYSTRESLRMLLNAYLSGDYRLTPAGTLISRGLERTVVDNSYRYRCKQLIDAVNERCSL